MLPWLNPIATSLSAISTSFGSDPTEPLTRLECVLSHQDLRRGAVLTALTTRFDYGFSDRFVVRTDLPLAHLDAAGAPSDSGVGDVRAQFGLRAFDERSFAVFFGGGFLFDTADERALGAGSDRVVLTAAASGSLPEIRSRLSESIEHVVSFDRDAGGSAVAFTKVDIHLTTEWSPSTWTQAGTEILCDWENGDQVGMNVGLQFGKEARAGFGLWIEPRVGLFGTDVEGVAHWSLAVGVRWLF